MFDWIRYIIRSLNPTKYILVYSQVSQVGAVIILSENNTTIFTLILCSSLDSSLCLLFDFWHVTIFCPKEDTPEIVKKRWQEENSHVKKKKKRPPTSSADLMPLLKVLPVSGAKQRGTTSPTAEFQWFWRSEHQYTISCTCCYYREAASQR